MVIRSLIFSAIAAVALCAAAPSPRADELTDVYARIIADPTNTDLNLRYATLAEARGEYRKALAAYERALVNDPGNRDAADGLQRVRRIIQPPLTQKTIEAGATWESNPLRSPVGEADGLGYGSFRVKDERKVGDQRWRTNLGVYGEAHARVSAMNYANINGDIGPIYDLRGTMLSFRPAIGAGAAYFDGRIYYGDVNLSGLFEGYLNGAYQWVRLRAGYRQYDPSFTSGAGFYADLTGKYSIQDIFHERDVFSIAPWLRWSGINGTADTGGIDFATGLYVEGGARFEYAKVLSDTLTASVSVKISDRVYNDLGLGSRQDILVSPGASLIFTNLFGPQTDLRFDYKYEWNQSNQTAHVWQNHAATVAVVVRR